MSKAPFSFELKYENISISDYPEAARQIGSPAFKQHLKSLLEQEYRSLGGLLDIKLLEDHVTVNWQSGSSSDELKRTAEQLLRAGDVARAVPILESLLDSTKDTDVFYNLGMIYSDQGRLEDAIDLLKKATKSDPKYIHAFVALGVAQLRSGHTELAEESLKKAVSLDSDDPYALRTLSAIHMQKEDYTSAISMLRHTLSLLPNDDISSVNLALCLLETGQEKNLEEAGVIANRIIATHRGDDLEEKAKAIQRKITHAQFRQSSGEREHSDAVFYCIDAIKKLKGLSQKEVAAVALEVAQLGQNGLQVNDAEVTYTIKSFPGKFTGLALVCLLHAAVQEVSPGTDSGFDIQKEYEIAEKLVNKH